MTGPIPLLENLYDVLPSYLVGIGAVVSAAVCGAAIGWDRERLKKPAGLTTMALICVGAAIYTQASLLLGGDANDPARVAAQIVTGIGFLGGGVILRERGRVSGITTAATIWAVAAVGIVLGAGYLAGGLGLTALVLGILTGVKRLEHAILGPCAVGALEVAFAPDGGRAELTLRAILDQYGIDDGAYRFTDLADGERVLTLSYCPVHRHHRGVAAELAAHPAVRRMASGVSP
ncbi:MAG: MgtC/SapB family protein [Nitrospirae bacterium]|nr:MgtC/SapB family protein [Nitrospirota bacterium]